MVLLLLENGANINAEETEKAIWFTGETRTGEITALQVAVLGGRKEIAQLLLENGATINAGEYKEDVNVKTECGKTALNLVTYEKVVRLLLTDEIRLRFPMNYRYPLPPLGPR